MAKIIEPRFTEILCEEILIDESPCCAVCYANVLNNPEAAQQMLIDAPDSYPAKIMASIQAAELLKSNPPLEDK